MSITLKSPISRFGGKYYLTDWLVKFIPGHTVYLETFCGAGHLLFAKSPSPVEVISDIDGHLINFFRVIQHPEKRQTLIERLNYMPYSRQLWQEIRFNWKQGNIPGIQWKHRHNGFILIGHAFQETRRTPSITGRNPVQSFRNAIKDLDTIAERLRNVCIENLDYQECIRRYDSPQTLFCIDSPYYGHEGYYGDTFAEQDHYKLSGILHNVQAKVMLSHYECDTYNQLYGDWNKYIHQSFKGSHKAAPGTEKPVTVECLFCNFEPLKTRSLFDAME